MLRVALQIYYDLLSANLFPLGGGGVNVEDYSLHLDIGLTANLYSVSICF